ncbi:hypothetical protein ADICYQ_4685 [Cyclobacterium qasimii M12-11B]|uniref:Uncharacterized protein n=1 Tax=Cyclobacterium qasimii M12-11B TaxID=641524 RepID=S7V9Q1_9BACT|nr:hypothetical protein ADICYQ_4685 [Cyclobacterium qasimii M12-11B]
MLIFWTVQEKKNNKHNHLQCFIGRVSEKYILTWLLSHRKSKIFRPFGEMILEFTG